MKGQQIIVSFLMVLLTTMLSMAETDITDFVSDYGSPTVSTNTNEVSMSGDSYNSMVKAYNFELGKTYTISMDLVSYVSTRKNFYVVGRNGTGTSGTFDTVYHSTTLVDGDHISVSYTPSANKTHLQVWHDKGTAYSMTIKRVSITEDGADAIKPTITLLGNPTVTLSVGDSYTDVGATAADDVDGNITANIIAVNSVDTSVEGNYTVIYNVSDAAGNAADTVTRTVIVNSAHNYITDFASDYGSPVVTPNGTATTMSGDSYTSMVTAYNFELGKTYTINMDIDSYVTDSKGLYVVARNGISTTGTFDTIYQSTTISGGTHLSLEYTPTADKTHLQIWHNVAGVYTLVVSNVEIIEHNSGGSDTLKPTISLTGSPIVSLTVGDTYVDAGATATDNVDGNLTASIDVNNTVDTSIAATYTVKYNVSDSAGNMADEVSRLVIVSAPDVNNTNNYITDFAPDYGTPSVVQNNNVTTMNGNSYNSMVKAYSFVAGRTYTINLDIVSYTANRQSFYIVSRDGTGTSGTFELIYTNSALSDGQHITVEYTPSVDKSHLQIWHNSGVPYTLVVKNFEVIDQSSGGNNDTTQPTITLLGSSTVALTVGDTYVDAGATATDDVDGNITANIDVNNTVNTAVAGTYGVTYNVSDAAGNVADEVVRTVTIAPLPNTAPVITLLGDNNVSVVEGTVYSDAGATANDAEDGNITANIVTVNPVDTATLGVYTVTYDVNDTDGLAGVQVTRVVTVTALQNTAPVITLVGNATESVVEGTVYNDAGATANDAEDGNITANIVTNNPVNIAIPGVYTVTYDVNDSDGLVAIQVSRTVTVTTLPNTAPVITLVGNATESVVEDSTYTDAGATANDAEDGNITANIVTVNPVDTALPGVYTVTYNINDSDGLAGVQVTREVTVTALPNTAPVITLLGESNVSVVAGTVYSDAGAIANDAEDGNITASIVINNPVNTAIQGVYTITYDVNDSSGLAGTQVTRSVTVTAPLDTEAPVITLNGVNPTTIVLGTTFDIDAVLGATVTDNVDTNLDYNITGVEATFLITIGEHNLTYNAIDTAGNLAQVNRTVYVEAAPNTAPVITLVGNATESVVEGSTYTDAGATANDAEDGNITASIVTVNSVNTTLPGVYTVTYDVNDSEGLAGVQVTREVTVTQAQVTITGHITNTSSTVLPNVEVKVFPANSSTALNLNISSDVNGLFSMSLNDDSNYTLQFLKDGYAVQVLPIQTPELNQTIDLDIVMIPRGAPQAVSESNTSELVGDNGASVIVQAGAFVTPGGETVSNNIQVTITPVDVSTQAGVASFPGNFAGIEEGASEPSPIVSYGTVEYQFTRNGEVLQLAPGQLAQIEIPIYVTTHPNGDTIVVGDTIPLWSLDEETGDWSQDGVGTVVSSIASPTGLALRATVSHFTWWNCDVSYNPGHVRVTVVGTGECTATIQGSTDANIGWRPSSASTTVPINTATSRLPVPSNGETCFWANISCSDGTTSTTDEVCLTIPGGTTEDVTLIMFTDSFKIKALPDNNITVEISKETRVDIVPLSSESRVNYSIISGSLPTGVTLTPKAVVSGSSTKAIISGSPTETGTFSAVIQGTDSDGNTDTLIINYIVTSDLTPPVLVLNGFTYVDIDKDEIYVDEGAEAFDVVDGNITDSIVVDSTVDTSVAGTYTIQYNVTDTAGNNAQQLTRYVYVRETDCQPMMYIFRDQNDLINGGGYYGEYGDGYDGEYGYDDYSDIDVDLFLGTPYVEYGAEAHCTTREEELDVIPIGSEDVNGSQLGDYSVEYIALDNTGSEVMRGTKFVHVILAPDTDAPEVTLNNEANMTLLAGSTYVEYNATVIDNRDTNLPITITGNVNTSQVGIYFVDYNSTDLSGNTGTARRQVNVVNAPITAFAYADRDVYLNDTIEIVGGFEHAGSSTVSFSWTDENGVQLASVLTFEYVGSSVGIHTLTLTAFDQYGATDSDTMDVNVTIRPDTSPNQFYFIDVSNVDLSTVQEADIYVTGIDSPTPISIVGGEYSLDDRATWTSVAGTVDLTNTRVYVRHTSSSSMGTSVDTNLTVGDVSDIFTSTTRASGNAAPVATINFDDADIVNTEVHAGQRIFADVGGTDDLGISFCQWKDNNDINITSEIIDPVEPDLFYHCMLDVDPIWVAGNYLYSFTIRDENGNSDTNELNITVLENSAPVVNIGGNVTIPVNQALNITAIASDADGDDLDYQWMYGLKGSGSMTGAGNTLDFSHTFDTIGIYEISFRAGDIYGVGTTRVIEVNVTAENIAPVITLLGSKTVILNQGDVYVEFNATANDAEDGNLTSSIVIDSSLVDTNTLGDYNVTYNVQDSAGAAAVEVRRTVTVISSGVAYVCPATSSTEGSFDDTFVSSNHVDINWSKDKFSNLAVNELEDAFNTARAGDATVSSTLKMPTQTIWDGMSESEKALYLINSERCARGLVVYEGVEPTVVTSPAQTYAEYLSNNALDLNHTADGRTPWVRLADDAGVDVGTNADFFGFAENLAYQAVASSDTYPTLYHPTVKSVYAWMYEDAGSTYGHRNFILAKGLIENSGEPNKEGLIGIGQSTYQYEDGGLFWTRVYTVLNAFDPDVNWDSDLSNIIKVEIQP